MGGHSASSSHTTQQMSDPEAARRMAAVAERQQGLSEQQWQEYKNTFLPYDRSLAESNRRLISPSETLTRSQLEEAARITPIQGRVQTAALQGNLANINDATTASRGLTERYYNTAMNGLNPNQEANIAGAEVARQYGKVGDMLSRQALAKGINPNSSAFSRSLAGLSFNRAKDIGTARSQALQSTKREQFARLGQAMGLRQNTYNMGLQALPARQGDVQLGGYRLTNPADRSMGFAQNVIAANKAGMSPLSQGRSSGGGWSFI